MSPVPTSTLTLGPTSSNYNDLEPGLKASLKTPIYDPSSQTLWKLKSKYGWRGKAFGSKTTEGLRVENTHSKNVSIVNASFRRLDFQFGSENPIEASGGARKVTTTNSFFGSQNLNPGTDEGENNDVSDPGEKTTFTGQDASAGNSGRDSLVFGAQTTLQDVEVDLKGGADYLEFKATAKSNAGIFALGDGADTVTFRSNSTVNSGNTVDLGDGDGDADRVVVNNNAKVDGLVVNNFNETDDRLVIGGVTKAWGDLTATGNSDVKTYTTANGSVITFNTDV